MYFEFKKARLMFIALLILGGCKTIPEHYYANNSVTKNEIISGEPLLKKKILPNDLPDNDVMYITDSMEDFLETHILAVKGREAKARLLTNALFDEDKLGMIYNPQKTYTAQEAFENKAGNCLAFAYLYAAFAEKAGLEVEFQEVDIMPEWAEAGDKLYFESRHVNLRLIIPRVGEYIIDIDRVALDREIESKTISKQHAIALYYANIAAEYMAKDKTEEAFKYLIKGISLEPEEASLWSSLGVLYRRNGLNEYAERAYFTALEYNKYDNPTLNNLSYLYKQTGEFEKSEFYKNLSKGYQSRNPYFRYIEAQDAFNKEQYDQALKHINYAISKNKKVSRFYSLQSEIYERLGHLNKAETAQEKAESL